MQARIVELKIEKQKNDIVIQSYQYCNNNIVIIAWFWLFGTIIMWLRQNSLDLNTLVTRQYWFMS